MSCARRSPTVSPAPRAPRRSVLMDMMMYESILARPRSFTSEEALGANCEHSRAHGEEHALHAHDMRGCTSIQMESRQQPPTHACSTIGAAPCPSTNIVVRSAKELPRRQARGAACCWTRARFDMRSSLVQGTAPSAYTTANPITVP